MGRGRTASLAIKSVQATERKRMKHPEDQLQRALCEHWARVYPATWALTFHVPNGLAAKNPKLAGIFAGLGMKSGVFDLICLARRGPYTGLAIELKSAHGRMADSQNEWHARHLAENWCAVIAFTFETAAEALRLYHELPAPGPPIRVPEALR
jgi:hypothetical protein